MSLGVILSEAKDLNHCSAEVEAKGLDSSGCKNRSPQNDKQKN